MDLINIAFCFKRIGNKEKSIEFYRRVLFEFPDNLTAKSELEEIK
jgi:hypothetical protein